MRLRALVWKRVDFRESSRVITLLTRERGRVYALAKGAHRANSVLLGRIDFLNRLEVTLSGRGMPILGRTRLLHEPRALREPARFLTATYLVELFDRTLVEGRADHELFDLLDGGLTLVERVPDDALLQIVTGIELRLLHVLGQLPALSHCAGCGIELAEAAIPPREAGVYCPRHAPRGAVRVPAETMEWLRQLSHAPGREWPGLTPPAGASSALGVLARWLAVAVQDLPRARRAALRACARRIGAGAGTGTES